MASLANDIILKKIVDRIVNLVNPDKIILFGSRATGKATKDSDYDVCVLKKNANKRKLTDILYGVGLNVGVPVDMIVTTPNQLEKNKDKWYFVYHDIFNEGKVIYEK